MSLVSFSCVGDGDGDGIAMTMVVTRCENSIRSKYNHYTDDKTSVYTLTTKSSPTSIKFTQL